MSSLPAIQKRMMENTGSMNNYSAKPKKSVLSPSLYSYTSLLNPSLTDILLLDNGYPQPQNNVQRVILLSDLVVKQGEEGLKKIAAIHPDKELFDSLYNSQQAKYDKVLNCDGCDNCNNKDKCLNFTGSENLSKVTPMPNSENKSAISEKTLNTLIVTGAVMFTTIVVAMMVTGKK